MRLKNDTNNFAASFNITPPYQMLVLHSKMNTEMTCYESFAEVTEDFYCSAVDVLKILVLHLHDYHARCFHSLRDALYDYFSTDAAPHTHANVSTKHTVTASCAPRPP